MVIKSRFMRLRRKILYICVATTAMLTTIVATAQERHLLSRSALDSLVNPPLSTSVAGYITAECEAINLGKISDSESVTVEFKLRNTGDQGVNITALRSTCSCLRVSADSERIEPQGKMSIVGSFDPVGRSGDFLLRILVYTDLDSLRPTLKLSIEGDIEANDTLSHLSHRIGALRLSRKEVTIGESDSSTERIAVVNTSERPIRITSRSTIESLNLRSEPEVIAPKGEGDIVISYKPDRALERDITTMLLIEGIEAPPIERMIKVTIKR